MIDPLTIALASGCSLLGSMVVGMNFKIQRLRGQRDVARSHAEDLAADLATSLEENVGWKRDYDTATRLLNNTREALTARVVAEPAMVERAIVAHDLAVAERRREQLSAWGKKGAPIGNRSPKRKAARVAKGV